MDVIYEESAINQRSAKEAKKYTVLNIFSWIFIILGVFFLFLTISSALTAFMSMTPNEDVSAEMISEAKAQAKAALLLYGFFAVDFYRALGTVFPLEKTRQRKL